MKVWVVEENMGDYYAFDSVFSSLESAQEYKKTSKNEYWMYIKEVLVDEKESVTT